MNPLNQNVSKQRKKNFFKNNWNICVSYICNPVSGAKMNFEKYNWIKDALLHSLIECEYKTYPKREKKCQLWDSNQCILFPKTTAIMR
jgi:hypothetical protein